MIYTVGHRAEYLKAFERSHPIPPKKVGKSGNYCGGSVWRSQEEALKYCNDNFAVFGVDADWEQDTEPNTEGGDWHNLLVDSDLILLSFDTETDNRESTLEACDRNAKQKNNL